MKEKKNGGGKRGTKGGKERERRVQVTRKAEAILNEAKKKNDD